MTLVELMISMALFSMLSIGLFAGVIHSRRMAENAVYESTAVTVALAYLEQIRNIQYPALLEALPGGPAGGKIPTMVDQGTEDPLYRDLKTKKTILIDTDEAGQPESFMDMWVTAGLRDLRPVNGLRALEVTIDFEWKNPESNSIQRRVFKSVIADVR